MCQKKNVFDGLMSRLNTAQTNMSEFEYMSIEISKTENQGDKRLKKWNRISKNYWTINKKYNI